MKIYIVEEDNYECWIEPQVFINPDRAIAAVKMRYEEVKKEQDITDKDVDGLRMCSWWINEEAGIGTACISVYQDYWRWRITEREV